MSDKKPVIFISYSHKDRSWLEYVRSFFEPLSEHWSLQIWDDKELLIGDDWRQEIYSALDSCRIFVLLVSRYALASDFIINDEVGRILKRPKGDVQLCPIVVTPYYTKKLDWLDQPNRRPPDDKSLFELLDPARDREMAVIAGQIDKILEKIPKPIATAPSPIKLGAPDKPRTAFPSIVDYGRLPETPYRRSSAAMTNSSNLMKLGLMKRPGSSRLLRGAALARRRSLSSGSYASVMTAIGTPMLSCVGRFTAKVPRSALPPVSDFSIGRSES